MYFWKDFENVRLELRSLTNEGQCMKNTPYSVLYWSGTWDSNSQPHAPKACALANCASSRKAPISIQKVVGVPGLEPGTSTLSVSRSNQLSYTPVMIALKRAKKFRTLHQQYSPLYIDPYGTTALPVSIRKIHEINTS